MLVKSGLEGCIKVISNDIVPASDLIEAFCFDVPVLLQSLDCLMHSS
jgi:hypothetical protein